MSHREIQGECQYVFGRFSRVSPGKDIVEVIRCEFIHFLSLFISTVRCLLIPLNVSRSKFLLQS
jgi:hypothetical protein